MLETTANRISYTGSGTTGPFSFPYYFLEDNDLTVIKVTIATGAESTLTLTTDYTVSGAGEAAGGSVTLVASLSSAYKLVILRDPDVLQSTAYPRNDPFPSATHERVVDKLTMLVQRLKDRMDRSIRLSDGDTSGISVELSGLDAGEVVRVNADGTALEGAVPTDMDLALVSAFVETLLDDADASAFLTTLGVSTFAKTLLDDASAAAARSTLQLEAIRADIASATTLDLDATLTHSLNVTGTTATTGITLADGSYRILRANAAWPITHGASLICPGSASYTCAAGDLILAIGEPAGVVRLAIWKADGTAVVVAAVTPPKIIQVVEGTPYVSYSSTATTIPNDDTIPQITEGAEWATVTITPTSASSRLRIEAFASAVTNGTAPSNIVGALFKDSTADAIAAGLYTVPTANYFTQVALSHELSASSTSAQTFRFRMGATIGTCYVNGNSSARLNGGVNSVRIRVTEIS